MGIEMANGGNHYCKVCGEGRRESALYCDECGVNRNTVQQLIDDGSEAVVWVGGSGYGIGGAYSDTFHVLDSNRCESICGRLEMVDGGGVGSGLQWATPILSVEATKYWQSELCGFCERRGGLEPVRKSVGDVLSFVSDYG